LRSPGKANAGFKSSRYCREVASIYSEKKINMAMFDIEDSDDIDLKGNKTTSENFLKAKNVSKINAVNNEVNSTLNKPKSGILSWVTPVITTVITGVVASVIAGVILYHLHKS
jgi:hypothetical protein